MATTYCLLLFEQLISEAEVVTGNDIILNEFLFIFFPTYRPYFIPLVFR